MRILLINKYYHVSTKGNWMGETRRELVNAWKFFERKRGVVRQFDWETEALEGIVIWIFGLSVLWSCTLDSKAWRGGQMDWSSEDYYYYYYYSVVCLTTGPKPLPKRFLHIVRSKASSFKWEYPLLFLRPSSSFLRLLPRLLVTSISPFIFPSITCFRRQFLRKMWPIQLA